MSSNLKSQIMNHVRGVLRNEDDTEIKGLDASEKLLVPEYDSLSEAEADGRSIVRATGEGSDPEGMFRYEPAEGGYVEVGGGADDGGNVLGGNATQPTSTAVHPNSDTTYENSVVIGDGATATERVSVALGRDSSANLVATALGDSTSATGRYSTVVGASSSDRGNNGTVCVGYSSESFARSSTAIGNESEAHNGGTAVGDSATASGQFSTSAGRFSEATARGAVAIGERTSMSLEYGGRIGVNQLVFGGVAGTIADADLNNQEITVEADEANSNMIIRYKDSTGVVQTATITWDA